MKEKMTLLIFATLMLSGKHLTMGQEIKTIQNTMTVKIAMIQMKVVGGNLEGNLQRAEKMVKGSQETKSKEIKRDEVFL